jgi:uncharacterized membrane protein YedE/YeeE
MNYILQPWPWYVSGALIALIMFLMLFFGKNFGFSNNLRTLCTMCGADKYAPFFQFDWQKQSWNLFFLVGTFVGGWIAAKWRSAPDYTVAISTQTVEDLKALGFSEPVGFVPESQFGIDALSNWANVAILALGGFMVGFGARYAGGCTSGHAISGISDLQPASLLAVVGFFIGGLLMTHVLFPLIF